MATNEIAGTVFEDLVDARHRRRGRRDHWLEEGKHHHRHGHQRHVADEGNKLAVGQRAIDDIAATQPDHGRDTHGRNHRQGRKQRRNQLVDLGRLVSKVVGDLVETFGFVVLAHERLDHLGALDVFLQHRIEAIDAALHRVVQHVRLADRVPNQDPNSGEHDQHDHDK